ncbi:MAG: hypothetical protein RH917_10400 [Lacipirellulaceae bacterium]
MPSLSKKLNKKKTNYAITALLLACVFAVPTVSSAQTDPAQTEAQPQAGSETKEETKQKLQTLELADGALTLSMPAEWKKVQPRSRILKHEFSIAPARSDDKEAKEPTPGRMTLMSATGGVQANVARWIGQFKNADGTGLQALKPDDKGNPPAADKEGVYVEPIKGDGVESTLVDLRGTFADSPRGPFGPKTDRPGYRMLGLIIPTKEHGTWFVKFYGPAKLVNAKAKAFRTMAKGAKYSP